MPCSGLTGQGIMEPVGNDAPWYTGLPFIPYIDGLDTLKRHVDGPFMMPIVDKYSEMGTVLIGKVRPAFHHQRFSQIPSDWLKQASIC